MMNLLMSEPLAIPILIPSEWPRILNTWLTLEKVA